MIENVFHYDGIWALNYGPVGFYDVNFHDLNGVQER